MAGYVTDEELDVMCDGLFDNIEDFLDFSPNDEVLEIIDSACNADSSGNKDSHITADVGKGAFLHLDDKICRVGSSLDENKICDEINVGEDWVSKFLDDSYLDIDLAATITVINESEDRFPSPISVIESNSLNFSHKGGSPSSPCSSTSSCISSNNETSYTVSLVHMGSRATPVPARARSKRPRRAAPILPNMPIPILPLSSEGHPSIPTLLPECESIGESYHLMKKKSLAAGDASAESGITTRKCMHCGIQKTPQWRSGPMGPKTLCNACGVRYKSGRLFPEYRPAASPTFVSTIHSNSHKKVVEMRIKACQEKVESGMPLPQYPAVKNCELLAYIK